MGRRPAREVEPVLDALSRTRILRPVHGAGSEPAYEIFHDVLADAVLAWRAQYEAAAALAGEREAARRRRRRLLLIFSITALAFAVMGAVTLYALSQRDQAQRNETAARSALGQARRANGVARARTRGQGGPWPPSVGRRRLRRSRQSWRDGRRAQREIAESEATASSEAGTAGEQHCSAGGGERKGRDDSRASERAQGEDARSQGDQRGARRDHGEQAGDRSRAPGERAAKRRGSSQEGKARREPGHASSRASRSRRRRPRRSGRRASFPSAPETGLVLAAKAATLDPKLTLVESTLRAALLATRAERVLRAGDTHTTSGSFSPTER